MTLNGWLADPLLGLLVVEAVSTHYFYLFTKFPQRLHEIERIWNPRGSIQNLLLRFATVDGDITSIIYEFPRDILPYQSFEEMYFYPFRCYVRQFGSQQWQRSVRRCLVRHVHLDITHFWSLPNQRVRIFNQYLHYSNNNIARLIVYLNLLCLENLLKNLVEFDNDIQLYNAGYNKLVCPEY